MKQPIMRNYYELLGVARNAAPGAIKKAFREQAKRLHPDIAGAGAAEAMRRLLTAYEVLSSPERRHEYDRAYTRFVKNTGFDYRAWLRARAADPASGARLVFFELLHLEEDAAISIWRGHGGLDFPMERYLEREDWMDCLFILAEELDKRGCAYEAFRLLAVLVREERRLPYFRHFMEELEPYLKALVRQRLEAQVDGETWVECLETLLGLGFPARDEARWMRSLAEALLALGDEAGAAHVMREAVRRDPALPQTRRLRRKLRV